MLKNQRRSKEGHRSSIDSAHTTKLENQLNFISEQQKTFLSMKKQKSQHKKFYFKRKGQ
jgi:hypothetical protein